MIPIENDRGVLIDSSVYVKRQTETQKNAALKDNEGP